MPSRYRIGNMLFVPAKNRRRSQRHWVAVPVLIRNGGSSIDGFSINISEGGVYLFAAANLSLGTQIEIEFRPPGRKRLVRALGIVRRRALYLYGIEFDRRCSVNWLPYDCTDRQIDEIATADAENLGCGRDLISN
jgi:hypothetical protein